MKLCRVLEFLRHSFKTAAVIARASRDSLRDGVHLVQVAATGPPHCHARPALDRGDLSSRCGTLAAAAVDLQRAASQTHS